MRVHDSSRFAAVLGLALWAVAGVAARADGPGTMPSAPPSVGESASDFTLKDVDGKEVTFSTMTKARPVVLIMLRGWPGYQCPLCTAQVGELIANAAKIESAGADVLMVYPGPAKDLDAHAKEFLAGKDFPRNFHLVIDPDYTFTNLYHLRWNANKETAYPSTFVVDKSNIVRFAKISHTHGDRAKVTDVIAAIPK